MIIDATDMIAGRIATIAAKKALLGEEVVIVNAEKAIITGKRNNVFHMFKHEVDRGIPTKGPFIPRMPDRFFKRLIRGMLPRKRDKGEKAFKRIMCYIGVPDEFKDKKLETIKEANISKANTLNYVTIGEITKILDAKFD